MNWILIVRNNARKRLNSIPQEDADRIRNVIEAIAVNPYSGDAEKMKGEERVWRRRVGSFL